VLRILGSLVSFLDRSIENEKEEIEMNPHFRQGDVLIRRVDESIPENAKKVEGRMILAYGEVTGHCHEVFGEAVSMHVVDESMRYLDVQMDAFVRHEEHAPIHLPPGRYRIVQQREYSPEEIRNVAD
jgi:hypothetical protein